MALEYQRETSGTRVSPLVIALLMVAGATILGLAIARWSGLALASLYSPLFKRWLR
jgi:hypothetical protein